MRCFDGSRRGGELDSQYRPDGPIVELVLELSKLKQETQYRFNFSSVKLDAPQGRQALAPGYRSTNAAWVSRAEPPVLLWAFSANRVITIRTASL